MTICKGKQYVCLNMTQMFEAMRQLMEMESTEVAIEKIKEFSTDQ